MTKTMTDIVQEKYGQTAKSGLSSNDSGVAAVAKAFGYSAEELASIPAEANMGLSCGNPTALANLREGEVVVDLGSGGGMDVFLAASKIGPRGKAIGIDMTPEMVSLARKNAAKHSIVNVDFHQARIDEIPLPDNSVDVVISNCVINLAADKNAVFKEIFRILKPGGRVAVSDIALKAALPETIRQSVMAYVGCIAGAIMIDDYVGGLKAAGFADVAVVDSGKDLNTYSQVEGQSACCSPEVKSSTLPIAKTGCCGGSAPVKTMHKELADLLSSCNVNDYAASVKVYAIKPG